MSQKKPAGARGRFAELNKKLGDLEFAQKAARKIRAHRTGKRFAVKISELRQALETAKGEKRQQILNAIETLEKAMKTCKKGLLQK